MAFCKNCGSQINDGTMICPKCGASQNSGANYNYSGGMPPRNSYDSGGFGWGLLGFFIPLAGLILFLVWKDDKPATAKAAGLGALISVIIKIVFSIIGVIMFWGIFSSIVNNMGYYYY